jgi:hypothetical protein
MAVLASRFVNREVGMIRIAAILACLSGPAMAEPVLSIDITLAEGEDYGAAVSVIRSVGATASSLSLMRQTRLRAHRLRLLTGLQSRTCISRQPGWNSR